MKDLRVILGSIFGSLFAVTAVYFFVDAINCRSEWMCGLVSQLLSTPWWMLVTSSLQSNIVVIGVGLIVNTGIMFGIGYGIGVLLNKIRHHEG